jgi:hypothetical protein
MTKKWGCLIASGLIGLGASGCASDHDRHEHARYGHDRERNRVEYRGAPERVEVIEPGRPIGRPEYSGHPEYGSRPDYEPRPDYRR